MPLAAINADVDVMEFFPAIKDLAETMSFVTRMNLQLTERGYCYYAVDRLDEQRLIGFIGLSYQTFASTFTPCTDIGWRLARREWGNGFAIEGVNCVLDHGFRQLKLDKIVAIAPVVNVRSVKVMQRTGMRRVADFVHPLLAEHERLKHCVLYEKARVC